MKLTEHFFSLIFFSATFQILLAKDFSPQKNKRKALQRSDEKDDELQANLQRVDGIVNLIVNTFKSGDEKSRWAIKDMFECYLKDLENKLIDAQKERASPNLPEDLHEIYDKQIESYYQMIESAVNGLEREQVDFSVLYKKKRRNLSAWKRSEEEEFDQTTNNILNNVDILANFFLELEEKGDKDALKQFVSTYYDSLVQVLQYFYQMKLNSDYVKYYDSLDKEIERYEAMTKRFKAYLSSKKRRKGNNNLNSTKGLSNLLRSSNAVMKRSLTHIASTAKKLGGQAKEVTKDVVSHLWDSLGILVDGVVGTSSKDSEDNSHEHGYRPEVYNNPPPPPVYHIYPPPPPPPALAPPPGIHISKKKRGGYMYNEHTMKNGAVVKQYMDV